MTSKLVKNNSGRKVRYWFSAVETWVTFDCSRFLSDSSDTHFNLQISCRSYLVLQLSSDKHIGNAVKQLFITSKFRLKFNPWWRQESREGIFIISRPDCRTPSHSLKLWQHHSFRTMWSIQKKLGAMHCGYSYKREYQI